MSTIKLNGTSSGSSIIKSPDSGSTNQTFTLPASSGTLVTTTDAGVAGITSAADATAITIGSDEQVTISNSNSADNTLTIEALNDNGNEANVKLAGDISGAGMGSGEVAGSIQYFNNTDHIASISGMRDGGDEGQLSFKTRDTSDSAPVERLIIKKDGRGLSQFTAKAWVNFHGTGTPAINDSHNISSITDINTGNYRANFTNTMANNNYSYCGAVGEWDCTVTGNTPNTSYAPCYAINIGSGGLIDKNYVMVLVFGD